MSESVVDVYEDFVISVVDMFLLYGFSENQVGQILSDVFDMYKLRIKDEE